MAYDLLQLAISNLGRARARLLMTAGGVVVGTTAVILLIALTIGLQQAAEAGIGSSAAITQIDVYVPWLEGSGNQPKLNDDAVRDFWKIPGVRVVIPTVRLQSGELRSGDYFGYADIQGIDPRLLPYMGLRVQKGDLSLQPGEVLGGVNIGKNFYDPESQEYQPVSIDIMEAPIELRLMRYSDTADREIDLHFTGELAETGGYSDYVIYMPIDEVIRWNEWITGEKYDQEDSVYDKITIFATNRETANSVAEAVRELGFGAGGLGEYLDALASFFTTMRVMLGVIGGIALLVAAFGVANTMMMAILERTREIGVMKAIGATNEAILSLFLLEAGLVGFSGGGIGVLLSKALQNLVNTGAQNLSQGNGGIFFLPIDPSQIGSNLMIIPSELIVFALILATGVGIAAGLYPAWRAAQLPPVIALKHD